MFTRTYINCQFDGNVVLRINSTRTSWDVDITHLKFRLGGGRVLKTVKL